MTILFTLKVEHIAAGNQFYRNITETELNFNLPRFYFKMIARIYRLISEIILGCQLHKDCWKDENIKEEYRYCINGICQGNLQVTFYIT